MYLVLRKLRTNRKKRNRLNLNGFLLRCFSFSIFESAWGGHYQWRRARCVACSNGALIRSRVYSVFLVPSITYPNGITASLATVPEGCIQGNGLPRGNRGRLVKLTLETTARKEMGSSSRLPIALCLGGFLTGLLLIYFFHLQISTVWCGCCER